MQAPNPRQVVAWEIVDDLDIGAQRHARKQAFKQVVAQQRVVGHAAVERALERVDVVNALADVTAFAKEILIHVRHRRRVRVEADVPGEHLGKRRRRSADRIDRDARLQNAVAFGDAARLRIEARAIQRMGQRAHQLASRVQRQIGVRIERDHVPHGLQLARLADDDVERRVGGASQHPIELVQLPALPLPSHPPPLRRIPDAAPMQQVEASRSVPSVQRPQSIRSELHELLDPTA